jgi:glutamate carboxypeptidase
MPSRRTRSWLPWRTSDDGFAGGGALVNRFLDERLRRIDRRGERGDAAGVPPGEIEELIGRLQGRQEKIVSRIGEWAGVNSGTHHAAGVTRMAAMLYSELEGIASKVALFALDDAEKVQEDGSVRRVSLGPGVRASQRLDAPVRILLNGHLDTVFAPEHPFQEARREGERLIGPGVADMKGGLAVMVEALRLLEEAPFRDRIGWEVILTSDEEIGSPQSADVLVAAAADAHVGLIFEPCFPDGQLVSSRPGLGSFLVQVKGRPAHAGRDFGQGRSAIVTLAEIILAFHRLNEREGLIVNVGLISGGGPLNIVPANASCRVALRARTSAIAQEAEEALRSLAADMSGREGIAVRISGGFKRPPKPLTPQVEALLREFRICARENGGDLDWRASGGGSDGNNLQGAGLPTIDSLGVRGGNIHTSEEFMDVGSVTERIALTARFLLKVARGEIGLPRR